MEEDIGPRSGEASENGGEKAGLMALMDGWTAGRGHTRPVQKAAGAEKAPEGGLGE